MKVGFLLFFLNLYNALSENAPPFKTGTAPVQNGKVIHGRAPKKDIQLYLARKMMKPKSLPMKRHKPENDWYTAFPAIGEPKAKMRVYNVPDSPFFPLNVPEQKTRVKKVLPDYAIGSGRKKRSVSHKKTHDEAVTTKGTGKVSEAPNKNKTIGRSQKTQSKDSNSKTKKSKRNGPKIKRLNRGRGKKRNRHLRSSNVTSKPLKYTKRSKLRQRVNKTKSVKRSRKGRREVDKPKQAPHKASRRLIAAKDASIEDYPYVVSIQKDGEHWCAGSLLNPRLVITTANCVWKSTRMSRMRIRAGSRYTDHGGQTAKIQEVRKHPEWSIRKHPDKDVALLLLDRNIKFSDKVHGVDLPNRVMMPVFEDAWVTSWGAERRDGVYDVKSVPLQSVHTRVMDRDKCNNITQRFGVTVTENFICLSQMGKRAPCTRDTGAPAVSDGVLWGMASWGIRKLCGTQRFPAMFSYLGSQSNVDFVANATHHMMADQRFNPYPDRLNS